MTVPWPRSAKPSAKRSGHCSKNVDHGRPHTSPDQRDPQWHRDRPSDARVHLHQVRQQEGAQDMHDLRLCDFGDLPRLLRRAQSPRPRRPHAVRWGRSDPDDLLRHADQPHHPRDRDRPDGADDHEPGIQGELHRPQSHCPRR